MGGLPHYALELDMLEEVPHEKLLDGQKLYKFKRKKPVLFKYGYPSVREKPKAIKNKLNLKNLIKKRIKDNEMKFKLFFSQGRHVSKRSGLLGKLELKKRTLEVKINNKNCIWIQDAFQLGAEPRVVRVKSCHNKKRKKL